MDPTCSLELADGCRIATSDPVEPVTSHETDLSEDTCTGAEGSLTRSENVRSDTTSPYEYLEDRRSTRPVARISHSAPLLLSTQLSQVTPTPSRVSRERPPAQPAPQSAPAALRTGLYSQDPNTPTQGKRKRARCDRSSSETYTSNARLRKESTISLGFPQTYTRGTPIVFSSTPTTEDAFTPVGTPDSTPGTWTRQSEGRRLSKQDFTVRHVDSILRNQLRKPLVPKKSDEDTGYVYVACSPNREGEVKIGCTADETVIRQRSLSYACGIKISGFDHTPVRFRNYQRVEQLALAELGRFVSYGSCPTPSCKVKQHREWVKVDKATAYRVIERWRLFAAQEPWTSTHKLKPFWSKRLTKHQMPSEEEDHADHAARDRRWSHYVTLSRLEACHCFVVSIYPRVLFTLKWFWLNCSILGSLYFIIVVPRHTLLPLLVAALLTGAASLSHVE